MIVRASQLQIGPAQIDFAGDNLQPLEGSVLNLVQQSALAEQGPIRAGTFIARKTPLLTFVFQRHGCEARRRVPLKNNQCRHCWRSIKMPPCGVFVLLPIALGTIKGLDIPVGKSLDPPSVLTAQPTTEY